jgi:glycosyltransferase involved in cell wall biosynthesis
VARHEPTIVQIIPRLDMGGAERTVVEVAAAIVKAGGRALVAGEPGRLSEDVAAAGGEIIELPAATKNPVRMLANARALERIIKAEGVALIHARSRAPAWSALMAARRTRIPFVTTYHGAYNERGPLKRLYNSVMARSDIVIANSRFTADLIQSRYGTPASKIRVIYRGIDLDLFDLAKISAARIAALRAAWGVGPDTRVVLQAARLTGWKGQPVVIAAAKRLQQRDALANTVIVMAGDAQGRDGYVSQLQADIAAAGLEGKVLLVGHVTDIAAAYAAAHVSVLASTDPEAFGRSGAESQAVGCPVIATNIGAPPETVLAEPAATQSQITGWLIPAGDPEALAATLEEALALDPSARKAMGDRAAAHARGSFTVGSLQRQTLQVYDSLLGTAVAERLAQGLSPALET